MDYFVSIENTEYFAWQTELLIESFKRLGLEQHLVIGIADTRNKIGKFYPNLSSHHRKFIHNNIGRNKKYPPLNRPLAVATALSSNKLQQPFAIIHADMAIIQPLPEPPKEYWIGFDAEPVPESVQEHINTILKTIVEAKGFSDTTLAPIGGSIMVFNNITPHFFNRVFQRTNQLMQETDLNWDIEQGAWLLTCYEHLGLYNFQGYNFSHPMTDNTMSRCFIHYKHGTTPYFNKLHYQYDGIISLGNPNPFQAILQQTPVTCTAFLQNLIQAKHLQHLLK